jgi:hypothetical protein
MLGEFLTANVSTPFMLFMVKGTSPHDQLVLAGCNIRNAGFGELTDEADIAFWTGILGKYELTNDWLTLT